VKTAAGVGALDDFLRETAGVHVAAVDDAFLRYQVSVEAARRNLETMIDRILKAQPRCQVILMTMDPPVGVHLERRPKIEDYYEMYREVAKQRKLLLVDHELNWRKVDKSTFNKYVPDGIHPSPLGCEKVILPQLLKSLGLAE
jgi:acyl-CoA thioesterase-1